MKPTLLAFLISAIAASSVLAQPAGALAMRDSLAALADTVVLRRIGDADARSVRPMDHLRRGFAYLRLHELTHERVAAANARAAFERARDLAPEDEYAELGLGLALAALADAEDADASGIVAGRAFARALGLDARSRARRALERALEVEPALAEAAAALARIALETHDPQALLAARAALLRVTGGSAASPGTWVARAHVALALGDPADALAAADAALATGGPLRAEALYVRAVALLRTSGREDEGARAYFEAARHMSARTAAAFRDELRELTDAAVRARFDSLPPAGRVEFLAEFWDVRAGLAGVSVGERLAEHHRRLAMAHERYRRQARWGAVPTNALLRERPDGRFDDRGVMLIRHGEPLDVVSTLGRELGRNESWLYADAQGEPYMAHFFEYDDFADYVLIYNVPCSPDWVADRLGLDPRMNVLRHRCSGFDQRSVSYEIRRDVHEALATDSHRPAFAADLPFVFDVHAFRGGDGRTDVLLSAAAPAGSLRAAADAADSTASLHLSVALVDTAARRVTRAATTATARGTGDQAKAHIELAAPPAAEVAVRVVARDGRDPLRGRLRGRGLAVPDYSGDSLMVSDVLLASAAAARDEGETWERAGRRLALAPAATFGPDGFRVFAEIYNLPAGESYTTELRVRRAGGGIGRAVRRLFGGGATVTLRFEETAAPDGDGVVRMLREVRNELAPGTYELGLRITHAARTVERARTLHIAAR